MNQTSARAGIPQRFKRLPWDEALQCLKPACEVVSCDEVVQVPAQLLVFVIVDTAGPSLP